jgi:hypothetical protein|tara:strand:+ start:2258 stop:2782 length:525 start_codon:yes stop_codon:yes gene_type:complete
LERDRGAILTVRSAALGVINYAEAQILEKGWWRKWRLLIGQMAQEDNATLLRDLYSYHLALVANSGISPDSFKSVQESAKDNLDQIVAARRPWAAQDKSDRLEDEVAQSKEDWKYFFDIDLNDEEQRSKYLEELDKQAEKALIEADQPLEEDLIADKIEAATKRITARRSRTRK